MCRSIKSRWMRARFLGARGPGGRVADGELKSGCAPDIAVARDGADDVVAASGMEGAEGLERRRIEVLGIPLALQHVDAIAAMRQDEV